jgi:hypothetical protein
VIASVTAIGWLKRIFGFKILIVWQQGITEDKRKENYLNLPAFVLLFFCFHFFLGILPTLLFFLPLSLVSTSLCKISNCCQTVQIKDFQIFYEATMQLIWKQNPCCYHEMQKTSRGRQFDRVFFK